MSEQENKICVLCVFKNNYDKLQYEIDAYKTMFEEFKKKMNGDEK